MQTYVQKNMKKTGNILINKKFHLI